MESSRVIVIGASAGGVQALRRLVATLPAQFGAPIFIVLHIGNRTSILPDLLHSAGPLEAKHATDREVISPGRIYIAPPDHHMLIEKTTIRLNRGAKEHHTRPAVDPLFRSAALAHGSRVIGVILTGRLDDGTGGLQAIKACNGLAVVQDPQEAEASSMPSSALQFVQVDYCVTLDRMAGIFDDLLRRPAPDPVSVPSITLVHEHDASLSRGDPMEHLNAVGSTSTFSCPDCSGTLWEINDSQPPRYRCHVGHAYTLRTLEDAHSLTTDDMLWSGLRALQEREKLLLKLANTQLSIDEGERVKRALATIDDRMQRLRELIEF